MPKGRSVSKSKGVSNGSGPCGKVGICQKVGGVLKGSSHITDLRVQYIKKALSNHLSSCK